MDNNSFKNSLAELEAIKSKALSVQQEISTAKQDTAALSEVLAQQDAQNIAKYAQQGASAQIEALEKVESSSSKKSKNFLKEWSDTFKSLSNSAKDFGDLASDIFGGLGGFVSNSDNTGTGGISSILKILNGGFGGGWGGTFAEGGRPDAGKISLVGERGPELFVPDSAGTVVPNEELQTSSAPIVYQNFTFQSLDPATNMKLLQAQKNQIQSWVTEGIRNNQNGLRSAIKTV